MTLTEQVLTIAAAVVGTMITRFLPFLVFPSNKPTPVYIQQLGRFLPPAILAILVIYCYKAVPDLPWAQIWPQLLAGAATVAVHLWKRNLFLSIATGTLLYMGLLQML
ncbi:branched-chain amino acid transporter permease [Secundilactobacillus similis]|uniref:Branched-chain amino acid transporter AzlD n=1 Tax=Secundilactobacillus similis DSM 23365 = JCM 2765 TaxID=1423804 RepID=A0A0R2EQA0_9LACO|nr:branched-chain amino acid transporter permease [Secundilactobacillus similis]KRN18273.1 hypothetical protein FD14_GL002138 [Secundilactobacillus similis DSM 23365 = JCM 2765]